MNENQKKNVHIVVEYKHDIGNCGIGVKSKHYDLTRKHTH